MMNSAIMVLLLLATADALPQQTRSSAPDPDSKPDSSATLFALLPPNEKGQSLAILDPVVILKSGRFLPPPEYNYNHQKESDALYAHFDKRFYSPGKQYDLFVGGSGHGTVTVVKPTNLGCVSLVATARPVPSLPRKQMALSASSLIGMRLHANWRTSVTEEQRSSMARIATDYLKQKGVTVPAATVKLTNIVATKLGVSETESIIASISVKRPKIVHNLFIVATYVDGRYTPMFISPHVTKDVEDYTDNVEESLVDQLDIDGDGVDELVTISRYYESWNYTIYKRQHGTWQKVYSGGGGGC
jgi:hypothetical protein